MKYNHSEVSITGCGALKNSSNVKEMTYEQVSVKEISRRKYQKKGI